ncbi:hypothetical protein BDW22DRAFT_755883 [Trametopsis cervina]|nr:hypothetical protein BDW22DRAFT_755883 [Trametopsis cervina]
MYYYRRLLECVGSLIPRTPWTTTSEDECAPRRRPLLHSSSVPGSVGSQGYARAAHPRHSHHIVSLFISKLRIWKTKDGEYPEFGSRNAPEYGRVRSRLFLGSANVICLRTTQHKHHTSTQLSLISTSGCILRLSLQGSMSGVQASSHPGGSSIGLTFCASWSHDRDA